MITKESRVLLIDDSPAIQAILRQLLSTLGYTNVDAVSSAQAGLDRVRQEPYDVVFLDMVLPEESGDEFAEKALAENPMMKVVVTTALPYSHESVMNAISQGACDYLPKPIRIEALKGVVQRLERESAQTPPPRDLTYV